MSTQVGFDGNMMHFWMFTCKINGVLYKINRNNAMAYVKRIDLLNPARFMLRRIDDKLKLNLTLNASNWSFYMDTYDTSETQVAVN